MTSTTSIVEATEADIPALAGLAGAVWRAYYPGIISPEQIEYMLARMYAPETLRQEMGSQRICFYRLLVDGQARGFASIGPTDAAGVMKLHKLYLLPGWHGRGLGSRLLKHCQVAALELGARRLTLNVNKRNTRALQAYQRNGFAILESVVTEIGGGFVMDDYVMAKELIHHPSALDDVR